MRVYLTGDSLVAGLQQTTRTASELTRKRMAGAMVKAQKAVLAQGRKDIQSAGNFGTRWTEGLTAEIEDEGKKIALTVKHAVPYWIVFQEGRTIRGKPLLWIPLSDSDAVGISARDYPGRLFRVDRKAGGAPLLISAEDKEVKYTGHTSVTIPKKFHLVEICKDVAATLGQLYKLYSAGA